MDTLLAVNESDISFEILFHQNPHPMWIVEVATLRFLLVNDAAIKHYGYSYKEFMHSITLADIRPKEEQKDMRTLIKRIKHNQTVKKKLTHIKKDGSLIYVHITSYTVLFHNRECRMVLINDITDQIIKDQKITDAWNRIHLTLESITDGFITISNNWRITYWNKEAEKTFNITKEEAIGKSFWKVCHYGKNETLHQEFTHAQKTREAKKFEIYLTYYNKWLCINIYPGKNGLTVYFQDITANKNVEQQIENKDKRLDEIAYLNSHIIRKPIANVIGIVNTLEDDLKDEPHYYRCLEMLKQSAEELDDVIKVINARAEDKSVVRHK